MDATPAIPAASLILMREAPAGGAPEILFVERSKALRFGGGAIAFPGGRVDPGDEAIAAHHAKLAPEDAAARIAALRETWEETGIALGFEPGASGFPEAVADLTVVAPFARWCAPQNLARRFDTRFYVATAPVGAEAVADGGETTRVFWATAATASERVLAGAAHALFPTRRLLERLALFADAGMAAADPHSNVDRVIDTRVERRADGDWLRIPDDAGYPVTAERITPGLRG